MKLILSINGKKSIESTTYTFRIEGARIYKDAITHYRYMQESQHVFHGTSVREQPTTRADLELYEVWKSLRESEAPGIVELSLASGDGGGSCMR